VVEPSSSPSSSSSPLSKGLLQEPFHELPESLENQGVEIIIVLSIQLFSSRPLPTSDTGSPTDFGPKSLDNPIQTPKISLTIDSQLGLLIYRLKPLFDPIVISLYHSYNLYDQPGVPLELSPCTSSVVHRRLFPAMEPIGDAPITSPDESEISTPHTVEKEQHPFPP